MDSLGNRPKVSVCVVAYNHEMYIGECLRSLVEQRTNFPFEVLVGDDNSTDGTRRIVDEFARDYPEIVKPLYSPENRGPVANYMATHGRAAGIYVAHMDGDDIALPDKLQHQADVLDARPEISVLWHRMEFFKGTLRRAHPGIDFPFLDMLIGRGDLALLGPFGPHSSTMYRKRNFSLRYENFQALDWLISIELLGEGSGLMMNEVLGGYRVHGNGASGGAVANRKNRKLLADCQLELVRRFPEYRSLLALRALLLAGLDLAGRKSYFVESLKVFLACRRLPKVSQLGRLLEFYRYSKLPDEFR